MPRKKRHGRSGQPTGRGLRVRVKTARGRKASSTRWLDRQLNDPFVREARRLGFRSRAAFKLLQIDDKFRILEPRQRVLDLGAAPGGWTQVAVERAPGGVIVALDILEMDPVPGATVIRDDIRSDSLLDRLGGALGGGADVVLSDMAAPTTGHRGTDHLRTMALCEDALSVAQQVLAKGGTLVLKAFAGGAHDELMQALNRSFEKVRTVKPPASRPVSPETYVVATGYHG